MSKELREQFEKEKGDSYEDVPMLYIGWLESKLKAVDMPSDKAIHTAIARFQAGTVTRNDLVRWIKNELKKQGL